MPPTKSATLTEAELRLMDVLWEQGPSSVQQMLDGLPKQSQLAYNSVLTTIRILEKKGYVRHIKDGRAHIYRPLVEREEAKGRPAVEAAAQGAPFFRLFSADDVRTEHVSHFAL